MVIYKTIQYSSPFYRGPISDGDRVTLIALDSQNDIFKGDTYQGKVEFSYYKTYDDRYFTIDIYNFGLCTVASTCTESGFWAIFSVDSSKQPEEKITHTEKQEKRGFEFL